MLLMLSLGATAFAASAVLAISLAYPLGRNRLLRLPARTRASVLFATISAPIWAALLLSALALLPGLVALVFPALDHCAVHDDDHLHLCVVHGPTLVGLGASWIVLLMVSMPASFGIARTSLCMLRARRLLTALRRRARASATGTHDVVDTDAPIAITAGLFRPRVYMSSRLLRDLDAASRQVVLAHEAAHVRRRDPLTKLLAELAASLFLPRQRRMLLGDLALACEQACDEDAAAATGDRTTVAATLVRLGRMFERGNCPTMPLWARFGETEIAARVRALLDPPKPSPPLPPRSLAVTVAIMTAAVATYPLHHLTETILGVVLA